MNLIGFSWNRIFHEAAVWVVAAFMVASFTAAVFTSHGRARVASVILEILAIVSFWWIFQHRNPGYDVDPSVREEPK